jgi:hypothetical protein
MKHEKPQSEPKPGQDEQRKYPDTKHGHEGDRERDREIKRGEKKDSFKRK